MAANHHPDGLTIDVIAALQREVNDELRREAIPCSKQSPAFVAAQSRPAGARGDNR